MDKKIYEEIKMMRQYIVAEAQILRLILSELKDIRRDIKSYGEFKRD